MKNTENLNFTVRFDSDKGGEYVVSTEYGSKNRSGSYKDKADDKIVKQYAQPHLKERCYVYLLRCYFSKLYRKLRMNETFSTGDQGIIVHLLMQ